jgi:hypothetical protein
MSAPAAACPRAAVDHGGGPIAFYEPYVPTAWRAADFRERAQDYLRCGRGSMLYVCGDENTNTGYVVLQSSPANMWLV